MAVDGATLQALFGNKTTVSADLRKIKKYVKEELFQRVIFMFTDDQMDEGSFFHKDYMTNCRDLVGGRGMSDEDDDAEDPYMTHLWTIMAKEKSYKKWLSSKRSNTYQAVQDKFHHK